VIERKIHRHFDNLDQRWGECCLCGQIKYPEDELMEYEGKIYCHPHFEFRWRKKLEDEDIPKVRDDRPRGIL